ncbi:MAG: hypothetical protein ACK4TL_04020 [Hyphomicrobiaceae bacterium]
MRGDVREKIEQPALELRTRPGKFLSEVAREVGGGGGNVCLSGQESQPRDQHDFSVVLGRRANEGGFDQSARIDQTAVETLCPEEVADIGIAREITGMAVAPPAIR